ncbi:hypothetical protein DH2020_004417 [Rehmannia glutinosa]|uniref:DDE Tnp4 domain-containing protein n=1 Tax=Rehmannia glutinosa TaxID=99300 RepID=A0ABR0XPD4_REHGL
MVGKVISYYENHIVKEPCRDSMYRGHRFVMDVINGHHKRCHQLFRMEKHVFLRLTKELRQRNLLNDSREVSVEEQLAIFLMTIGHDERNRMLQERFQHSGETISRHFNIVLKALVNFSMSMIVAPSFEHIPSYIRNNPKYWPHFKGCIGAIDGTHVDVVIPINEQLAYRGRKGDCTQNFMAACSFDMRFTFIWAGWEGTAHDSRILNEAIHRQSLKFPMPPRGKYYVVDAGYPNMSGFLAPYKGTRYHSNQFRRGQRASGSKELFNHSHSSLRNIIERCFGVWKARWPILKKMAKFPFETQRLIVVVSMALHNYIRHEAIADEEFKRYDEDEDYLSDHEETEIDLEEYGGEPYEGVNEQQSHEMDIVRDAIADSISQTRRF